MVSPSALPVNRAPFAFALTIDTVFNALALPPALALVVAVSRLSETPPLPSPQPAPVVTAEALGSTAPSASNLSLSFSTLYTFYTVQLLVVPWGEAAPGTPRVQCPSLATSPSATTNVTAPGASVTLGPGVSTLCYRSVNGLGRVSATGTGVYVVAPPGTLEVVPRGAVMSGRPSDASQSFLRAVVRLYLRL